MFSNGSVEMKTKKSKTKRKGARVSKTIKLINEVHNQRGQLSKSRHGVRDRLLREAAKLSETPEDQKPLPKAVTKAFQNYQDTYSKAISKMPFPSSGQYQHSGFQRDPQRLPFRWASPDQFYYSEYFPPILSCFDFSSLTLLEYDFYGGPGNHGHADGRLISDKQASGYAGTASLVENVHHYNRSMFGFYSSFPLTGTGNDIFINISSHVHVIYGWLEALSFGKASYGEVVINSFLDVIVHATPPAGTEDLIYTDSVQLVYGVSPRGNYGEGDIGIWDPPPGPGDASHSVQFTATFPENSDQLVEIFEVIELRALRYHRKDRCNAVAQVSCTFDPIEVSIVTRKC
jgi:hypothetical protein